MRTASEIRVERLRAQVEASLPRFIKPARDDDGRLAEAMRYCLLLGGKRLRPILFLATAEMFGAPATAIMKFACGIECIHTYSLIHDDLPAMDDDDLRRGRPTSHKVFGEALAILAGDGLLTIAFELMSATGNIDAITEMARAAGWKGMVKGQAMDIYYERRKINPSVLRTLHRAKTAALIESSCVSGALVAGADDRERRAIRHYGRSLGLAFQIIDDLLDVTGEEKLAGKRLRKDAGKATYPSLFGVDGARRRARIETAKARTALRTISQDGSLLNHIAEQLLNRQY